jgi:hypothetical protein
MKFNNFHSLLRRSTFVVRPARYARKWILYRSRMPVSIAASVQHKVFRRAGGYSAVRPCIPQQLAQKLQLDTLECLVGNFYYLAPASDACV